MSAPSNAIESVLVENRVFYPSDAVVTVSYTHLTLPTSDLV